VAIRADPASDGQLQQEDELSLKLPRSDLAAAAPPNASSGSAVAKENSSGKEMAGKTKPKYKLETRRSESGYLLDVKIELPEIVRWCPEIAEEHWIDLFLPL